MSQDDRLLVPGYLSREELAAAGGIDDRRFLTQTRTLVAPAWERWLFAPYNLNYHFEHHLYPMVPTYNLTALHRPPDGGAGLRAPSKRHPRLYQWLAARVCHHRPQSRARLSKPCWRIRQPI